ncbi:MAG: hypothetical protein QOC63_5124 [Mycobacterium sp.]|jgi:uncharacterized protein YjbI with pentapeptide repeats|nr:hypothetical protein [Mycobacterium sp.]
MSSSSTQPPRRRPNSVLPRPRTVAGRTQGRLRLTSPTPAPGSWWRRATLRIRRFTGRVFTAGVWSRIGRLTTWIGAVGVAVAAFTGLVFSYQQYRLTEQGQITDRFTKAVEQLGSGSGSDKLDVRLGGIYSLERLARDSTDDRSTIMEVLSAFIRGHAPAPAQPPLQIPAARSARCALDANSLLPIDIQAAVTVIGRRDPTVVDLRPIDLSHACLCRANLAGLKLREADLSGTDLRWADFANVQTVGHVVADQEFHLKPPVDLSDAHLDAANLSHAVAVGARFRGARMSSMDLTGVSLIAADLAGATINFSNLTGADLSSTDLTKADLFHADLTGATLNNAVFTGADLTEAQLTRTTLDGVVYDSSTKWPSGFTPPPSS